MFEITVAEDIPISELKGLVSSKFKEQGIEIDPESIRLRDSSATGRSPGRVIRYKTLKPLLGYYSAAKSLFVQRLSQPGQLLIYFPITADLSETLMENDVVLIVQQWFPSKYELGPPSEIVVSTDATMSKFKEMLSQLFKIQNLGLYARSLPSGISYNSVSKFSAPDPLEIPDMPDWERKFKEEDPNLITLLHYPHDGEVVIVRDDDEPLKELTPEEKRTLQKAAQAKRRFAH